MLMEISRKEKNAGISYILPTIKSRAAFKGAPPSLGVRLVVQERYRVSIMEDHRISQIRRDAYWSGVLIVVTAWYRAESAFQGAHSMVQTRPVSEHLHLQLGICVSPSFTSPFQEQHERYILHKVV